MTRTQGSRILVTAAIVLVAINLRPAVSALGAVIPELRDATGLSGATSGLLLALPTLCFGLLGVGAPALAARIGSHRAVLAAIFVLTAGQLIRALVPGTAALFAGSVLALAGIAVANVLLPGLVRLHFPDKIAQMTAVYATLLTGAAAVAAGLTLPIEHGLGGSWQLGIGIWAATSAVALIPWLVLAARSGPPVGHQAARPITIRSVARTRIGWAMAGFFGIQSLHAYVGFGWLPEILTDAGLSTTTGAAQVAIIAAVGVPIAALVPTMLARMSSPLALILGLVSCYLFGYAGLILAPATATWVYSLLLGIGGGAFPLLLTLLALRARTSAGTTALSAFTQSVGYALGSVGPVTFGIVHDWTGGWTVPLVMLMVLAVALLLFGFGVAKDRYVEDELPTADSTQP